MTNFQSLFFASKGQPIEYGGQLIQMVDRLPISKSQKLCVVFESKNSDWRQGVHLSTVGTFEVNGQKIKNAVVLWEDTAPEESGLAINSKSGECLIKNVWDVGDGIMHSWHGGAAMIASNGDDGRRYRCNDGHADEDFDDLVFRVQLIPESNN